MVIITPSLEIMRRPEGLVLLVRVKCNDMNYSLTGLPPVTGLNFIIIIRIIMIVTTFSRIIQESNNLTFSSE